jgi:hypothetical protein
VRVVYDDTAVYVAVDCVQRTTPVIARLSRRDRHVESDWLSAALGTNGDGKTAYEFRVNAARAPMLLVPLWVLSCALIYNAALVLTSSLLSARVFPVALATFVPGQWLLSRCALWLAAVPPPVVAAVATWVAHRTWEVGLRSYQSTGS